MFFYSFNYIIVFQAIHLKVSYEVNARHMIFAVNIYIFYIMYYHISSFQGFVPLPNIYARQNQHIPPTIAKIINKSTGVSGVSIVKKSISSPINPIKAATIIAAMKASTIIKNVAMLSLLLSIAPTPFQSAFRHPLLFDAANVVT